LLDYTPGGPDFNPDAFFPPGTPIPGGNGGTTGQTSIPISSTHGFNKYVDIGGQDEVHGEKRGRHDLHRSR
jgi:hypothetical protein